MRGVSKRHEGTSTCNFRRRHTSLAYVPGNHNQPPADADDLKSNKIVLALFSEQCSASLTGSLAKTCLAINKKKRVERTRKYGD